MFAGCSDPLEFEIISQKTFKDGFRKESTTVFNILFNNTTGSAISNLEIRLKTCDGKVLSPVFYSDLYDNRCDFAILPGFGFLPSGKTTCEIAFETDCAQSFKINYTYKERGR
jgi:hypothetical protein